MVASNVAIMFQQPKFSSLRMYKHIFFDLDHTLWDHDTNAKIALHEVFVTFDLPARGIVSFDAFYQSFNEINRRLWLAYEQGKISQATLRYDRFRMVFSTFGVNNHDICDTLTDTYLAICPRKTNLLPYTQEILRYLQPKYPLHIITNGFNDVQSIKMECSGLRPFFHHVVTSQDSGYKKPDTQMFEYALNLVQAKPKECLMIGDTFYTDVLGAMRLGMDAVFFNPNDQRHIERPTFEISHLKELKGII